MREMAFLTQDYMMFHHNHHHDFNENDHHQQHHEDPSISLNILSSCPPQEFQGVPSLGMMNRSMSFSPGYHNIHQLDHNTQQLELVGGQEETENYQDHDHHGGDGGGDEQDELSDDGSHVLVVGREEKKKRLSMEQVKTLEKNFELGNKIESERKMQLAKALGLQPRQVAIWFQNRRARWKTKQLEKDFSVLKRQFDALKADNDSLLSHNKKLHAELISLRNREPTQYGTINLNNVDTKSYWSNNGSEISSVMNLNNNNSTSRIVTPRTGSPLLSSNPTNKLQFPTNTFIPTSITQLLQTNSSPKQEIDLQCPKIDPQLHNDDDDTFCNIYGGGGSGNGGHGGIENQPPAFWAWPDQQ